GIRDGHVTGVQTCALPIVGAGSLGTVTVAFAPTVTGTKTAELVLTPELAKLGMPSVKLTGRAVTAQLLIEPRAVTFGNVVLRTKIGRASCRERVEVLEVGG